jgi:hypothetical protein
MRSEFPVVIPHQIFGRLPIRSCLPQLLRHPGISGRPRHIHMDDLPRLQLDNEEGEKGTKEEISDLQEITGPHLGRMIVEKGPPSLSTSASWMDLLHILLNGPFTHVNIQLEKFSTNTFRSPKSIVCRHFFDEADRLRREPRLSRGGFRCALPEHAEELTVEAAEVSPVEQERGPVSRFELFWPIAPREADLSSDRWGVSPVAAR